MENSILAALDREVVKTYKVRQYGYGFRRVLDNESESVSYMPGTSFRLWINQEAMNYAPHWHPGAEMIIPLENTYTVTTDTNEYVLKPGDMLLIPGSELHQITAPPTGRRLILLFDFAQYENIHDFAYMRSFFTKPVLINNELCPSIYREECELLSEICKDYYEMSHLKEPFIYSKLLLFLLNYARFQAANVELRGYSRNNTIKQQELQQCFSTVFEYIDNHLSDDLTLETVAEVACFSKFHFSRIFKEYSGHSFYDYVRLRKIKAASTLLLDKKLSITEIALLTGFANLTTFNRTFRALKGCTPTEYRKLYCAP